MSEGRWEGSEGKLGAAPCCLNIKHDWLLKFSHFFLCWTFSTVIASIILLSVEMHTEEILSNQFLSLAATKCWWVVVSSCGSKWIKQVKWQKGLFFPWSVDVQQAGQHHWGNGVIVSGRDHLSLAQSTSICTVGKEWGNRKKISWLIISITFITAYGPTLPANHLCS